MHHTSQRLDLLFPTSGGVCRPCLISFPSAWKMQASWLEFRAELRRDSELGGTHV